MADSNEQPASPQYEQQHAPEALQHGKVFDRVIPQWRESYPAIYKYLTKRQQRKTVGDDTFGVVYAVTRYCNLACRHCAVNARYRDHEIVDTEGELSRQQVRELLDKVKRYSLAAKVPVFFMFGGGEPTLRVDLEDMVRYASDLFAPEQVGFCTNGTFRSNDEILAMSRWVGLLEVSLDGQEEYHNRWRMPGQLSVQMNAHRRTLDLIKAATEACPDKLEVTSVVTTGNLESLATLARFLRSIGVRQYSIHRPIPVGRMASHRSSIPSIADYYRLMAIMSMVAAEEEAFHLHVHHSLESIYSALLLGQDMHQSALPMGSRRHSIGISWDGTVHFDPWSLVPPFASLSPGNLLQDGCELEQFWKDRNSILGLMSQAQKANVRCRCCAERCTGGMRLCAMASFLAGRAERVTLGIGDIIAAVSSVDPACPLATD